jgi:imidazolonepropionase-like amidohydrolase
MIRTLAEKHVPVDPTLMAFRTKFWGDDPYYTKSAHRSVAPPKLWDGWPQRSNTADWTPEQYREAKTQWPKLLALVKAMFDGGVLITAGTDTPFPWIIPGVSFHDELKLLSEAGLPAADVLRAATINGAVSLKRQDSIGTVEAGKRADLVILRASPLDAISNTEQIELVVKGGEVFRPSDLLQSPPHSSSASDKQ